MTAHAAYTAAEAPVLLGNGVGVQSLEHISRKQIRAAVSVLLDLGIRATPKQAVRVVREYHEWRADDARRFVISEFKVYAQRRGDLMTIRSKPRHEWRTHT